MSVRQGMDVGAVRASARELGRHAGDVDSLASQATRSIGALERAWKGDDFAGLKQQWDSSGRTSLSALAEDLRSVSRELTRQADGQEKVSEDGEGVVSSGTSSGPVTMRDPDVDRRWIDPSHSRAPGVNPHDPDHGRRTPLGEGAYTVNDLRGEDWLLDEDGNAYPPGTAFRVDEDGNPLPVYSLGGSHEVGPAGPGQEKSEWRAWRDGHGLQRSIGMESGWSRTNHNPYAEWKTNPDRPWNDTTDPHHGLLNAPESIRDRAGAYNVEIGKGEIKNDLWEVKGTDVSRLAGLEHQWGEGANSARATLGELRYEQSGSLGLGPTGVTAAGSVAAGVYGVRGQGQFQSKDWNGMSAAGNGQAYAGGEVKAGGEARLGPGGAKIGVEAEAFAGAKVEGELTGKVGPAEVTAGAELSVGVGAHADIDAEVSLEKVDVSVDIGATLGIGGGVKFDISFSPKEALDLLPDLF